LILACPLFIFGKMKADAPKTPFKRASWALGCIALMAQILFMRSLMVVFYGNELSLGALFAVWLFWTAVGSGVVPRLPWPRKTATIRLGQVFIGMAACLPLTDLGIRFSRNLLRATAGEALDFGSVLVVGCVVFAPFCVLSGVAYAVLCRGISESDPKAAGSIQRIYSLETLGAAVGGLACTLFFILKVKPVAALGFIVVFSLLTGLDALGAKGLRWKFLRIFLGLLGIGFWVAGAPAVQTRLDSWFWNFGDLVASEHTAYGNVALVRLDGQVSFFENGQPLFTAPDENSAEEAVHYALLEHAAPRSVLLIGGTLGGAIDQAFKHPSVQRVCAVELDPALIRLAGAYLPSPFRDRLTDPRVTFLRTDARRFIRGTSEKFDAVAMNLPDPYTAQLNRFYTLEFFREARMRLNPGGVFYFSLPSSENAIGRELSDALSTVSATLAAAFPETVLLPGDRCRFLAAVQPGTLVADPRELGKRIRDRGLGTLYVQPYYLDFQLSKERRDDLRSRLHPIPPGRLNRDLRPTAFWNDLVLWSVHFAPMLRFALEKASGFGFLHAMTALALAAALTGFWIRKRRSTLTGVRLSVWSIGFSGIALELTILLAYQTLFGVLYQDMALIVAGYMAGLALGGFTSTRADRIPVPNAFRRLVWAQLALGVFPAAAWWLVQGVSKIPPMEAGSLLALPAFAALNAVAGLLGGHAFGLANHPGFHPSSARGNAAGVLYAMDLAGSLAGALLTVSLSIPLFGMPGTFAGIMALNVALSFVLVLNRPGRVKTG
jgi:spermidine synthase